MSRLSLNAPIFSLSRQKGQEKQIELYHTAKYILCIYKIGPFFIDFTLRIPVMCYSGSDTGILGKGNLSVWSQTQELPRKFGCSLELRPLN